MLNSGFVAWHSCLWHCDTLTKATIATVSEGPTATNYGHKMKRNKQKMGSTISLLLSSPAAISLPKSWLFQLPPFTDPPHSVSDVTTQQSLRGELASTSLSEQLP